MLAFAVAGAGSWVAARVGTPSSSAYRPRAARRVDRLRRRSDGDQQYRALRRAPTGIPGMAHGFPRHTARPSWFGGPTDASVRHTLRLMLAGTLERGGHHSHEGHEIVARAAVSRAEWGNEARRRPTRRRPTAGRAGGEEASSQLARKGGARRPWEGTTLAADWGIGCRLLTNADRASGAERLRG
ncbi:hypothetical protein ERJ75_000526400 [Trypanosoma vivax]|nr:hypothetical protein ERJ75_000526400 [Trypanosoma vivax]